MGLAAPLGPSFAICFDSKSAALACRHSNHRPVITTVYVGSGNAVDFLYRNNKPATANLSLVSQKFGDWSHLAAAFYFIRKKRAESAGFAPCSA
jgi:hypothetical protein